MKLDKYSLYLIINKINNKKYIGQTKRKLRSRFVGHISKAKQGSTSVLHCAMRKYGIENFEIILLEQTNDLNSCNIREIELIKEHNTLVPIGYNMIEGGKNIEYKKIKNLSKEHKNKIQKSHLKNCKSIIQFEITTGNIIKEWISGRDLLRNKYSRANISKICKSDKKFGYMYDSGWCYKEFYENLKNKNILINLNYNKIGRTINCYNMDNTLVKIYQSIVEAAKEMNCSPSSISDVLKNRCKTCKGYIWQYSNI